MPRAVARGHFRPAAAGKRTNMSATNTITNGSVRASQISRSLTFGCRLYLRFWTVAVVIVVGGSRTSVNDASGLYGSGRVSSMI